MNLAMPFFMIFSIRSDCHFSASDANPPSFQPGSGPTIGYQSSGIPWVSFAGSCFSVDEWCALFAFSLQDPSKRLGVSVL